MPNCMMMLCTKNGQSTSSQYVMDAAQCDSVDHLFLFKIRLYRYSMSVYVRACVLACISHRGGHLIYTNCVIMQTPFFRLILPWC